MAPCRGIGKVVWAVIGAPASEFLSDLDRSADRTCDVAETRYDLVLGSVPTDLLIDAKAHVDSVVREAVLIGASAAVPPPMAALVRTVTEDFAEARTEIKRQALASAARGDRLTELRLSLPLSAAEAGERYLSALDEADRFARNARWLTMAPPPSHRAFREWYVRAIIDQLRAAAEGTPAPDVTPFTHVLAERVDELANLEESERRLRLLQRIAAGLVAESSVEAIAETVVAAASDYPGVVAARVYLAARGRVLRLIGWAGPDAAPDSGVIAVDGDVPAAQVVRTGRSMSIDSMCGQRSIHLAPLRVSGAVLGVLGLTFAGSEVDDEAQRAFVQAIADALAQAIERAQAKAVSERERGRDLLLLTAQVDVLTDIVNGVDLRPALEGLLRAVEEASSDGMLASVLLLSPDGEHLVHGAAPSLPEFYNEAIDGIEIGPAVGSCGTAAYLREQVIVEDVRTDERWAGFRELADRASLRACWSTPIVDRRGALLGTFALYYPQPQAPSQADLALIAVLVRAVAIAIERSRADEERNQELAAERAAALTLQHALSPAIPPSIGRLNLAAHYRTGDPEVQVGGDWFDAVPGRSGAFLLVGDVQGHDLQAAALMGQLRTVARVAATETSSPAEVLQAINRYLLRSDDRIVTALVVHLDLEASTLATASAGHLPPLALRPKPDGWHVTEIELDPGPPLGVDTEWSDSRREFDEDSILFLYTDGLVEARSWPIDHGIGLLHKALSSLPPDADLGIVLEAALEILPSGSRGDDVAVLAGSTSVAAA